MSYQQLKILFCWRQIKQHNNLSTQLLLLSLTRGTGDGETEGNGEAERENERERDNEWMEERHERMEEKEGIIWLIYSHAVKNR